MHRYQATLALCAWGILLSTTLSRPILDSGSSVAWDSVTPAIVGRGITVLSGDSVVTRSNQQRFQSTPLIRSINTTLAAFAIFLVLSTYFLLLRHSADLFRGINVPAETLEANIASVLGDTWPQRHFPRGYKLASKRGDLGKEVTLLYSPTSLENAENWTTSYPYDPGELWESKRQRLACHMSRGLRPEGFRDVFEELRSKRLERFTWLNTPPQSTYFFRTASPAMRNAVQMAIWEWVSLLLVAIMVVNTVSYNGFMTGDRTPDQWLRLGLAVVYAAANVAHFIFAWRRFLQTYSKAVEHACWSVICKSRFLFGRTKTYYKWMNRPTVGTEDWRVFFRAFDVETLGEVKFRKMFQNLYPRRGRPVYEDDTGKKVGPATKVCRCRPDAIIGLVYLTHAVPEEDDKEFKDMDSLYKSEIGVLEKATESALERVTANVLVGFGICLATGLSPWTSTLLNDATSTQLGSYAMLLSISSGLAALLTSSSHLNNMSTAAAKVVELTEAVLLWPEGGFDEDFGRRLYPYSFTRHTITLLALWRAMGLAQRIMALLFGPILVLLKKSREAPNFLSLEVKLGGNVFWFTAHPEGYAVCRETDEAVTGPGNVGNEAAELQQGSSVSTISSDSIPGEDDWSEDEDGGSEWRRIREERIREERIHVEGEESEQDEDGIIRIA